ncbi:hypothetical protein OOK31_33160 [Streptomyces sp. NBC_00249]|nr:hypothetical protein [Streptomyces sp. NBC_00249]MCX5198682.1 hypothetical protein [Streptomyces sp. NBC_00249]
MIFAAWGQPLFGAVTRRAYRTPYPTDALLGTDDENRGGHLRTVSSFCGA